MMHEAVRKELGRIGASEATPPGVDGWRQFVQFVDSILQDTDKTTYRLERSLTISSEESRHLHDRQRALASCASALLLAPDGMDGVPDALSAVLAIADVAGVWVERRNDQPEMELVAAVGIGPAAATADLDITSKPIVVSGKVEGRLSVAWDTGRDSWGDEQNLVQTVASMFSAHWSQHEATRSLEALLAAKDRFVASVSHELRTPLTAVVGFAGQLSEGWAAIDPADRRELVDLIFSQSLDVSDLIDDLLVVARSEIDALQLHEQPVDLLNEATEVCERMHSTSTPVHLSGSGMAWADSRRVRQIVRNLVTNAFRYGGTDVQVTVHQKGDRVVLEVCDDGSGIDPAMQERIFLPFQSAHEPGSQPDSIGLGLWVGRQLAELMGGSLAVRSRPGETVFALELPASVAEVDHSDYPRAVSA